MSESSYPPVAFRFEVKIQGAGMASDVAFQEVQGLEAEIEVETVAEGGENTFVHRLPKALKHPNIVLKRGIETGGSGLSDWCRDVIEGGFQEAIKPADMEILLLDAGGSPLATWQVSRAYPLKWSVAGFDAMKNEIALESIEFAHAGFKRREP